MQYERTIKILEKAGFQVARKIENSIMFPGEKHESGFTARRTGAEKRIEANKQGDEIISMRVVHDNDRDEPQTDYCAGTWVDTIKRARELADEVRQVPPMLVGWGPSLQRLVR